MRTTITAIASSTTTPRPSLYVEKLVEGDKNVKRYQGEISWHEIGLNEVFPGNAADEVKLINNIWPTKSTDQKLKFLEILGSWKEAGEPKFSIEEGLILMKELEDAGVL